MWHIVQDSKYEAETISIILSFADVIPAGQTISGTPVISVSLFTGQDSNPSNLLYEGVTIYSGTAVEQRFRLGIPGNIYYLLYQIVTTGGETFEKDCYLAILPDESSAVPTYQEIWESTQLYPVYEGPDGFQNAITWLAAKLTGYRIPIESFTTTPLFQGGNLIIYGSITYNVPNEEFTTSPNWVGGTLVVFGSITYAVPNEAIKNAIALISGTLVNTGLSYSIPYESFKNSITFVGGTLT